MKTVNQERLCYEVWNLRQTSTAERVLVILCQWGTYCKENVLEVLESSVIPSDKVGVVVNEDETADIKAFILKTLRNQKEDEKLIIISYLPWDKNSADEIMTYLESRYSCIRYEAQAIEWLNMNFSVSDFNQPLRGFLSEHPEYFTLPYSEKPLKNSAGPCPQTWYKTNVMWSDIYSCQKNKWKKMSPTEKIRQLLLCVASYVGNYEPMMSQFDAYLLETNGYDNLVCTPEVGLSDIEGKASFTNLFDENGNSIWD